MPSSISSSLITTTTDCLGFAQAKLDSTLFLRIQGQETTIILAYVDDLLITWNILSTITKLKTNLTRYFHIKDLICLKYSEQNLQKLTKACLLTIISTLDLVVSTNYLNAKPISTPGYHYPTTLVEDSTTYANTTNIYTRKSFHIQTNSKQIILLNSNKTEPHTCSQYTEPTHGTFHS